MLSICIGKSIRIQSVEYGWLWLCFVSILTVSWVSDLWLQYFLAIYTCFLKDFKIGLISTSVQYMGVKKALGRGNCHYIV